MNWKTFIVVILALGQHYCFAFPPTYSDNDGDDEGSTGGGYAIPQLNFPMQPVHTNQHASETYITSTKTNSAPSASLYASQPPSESISDADSKPSLQSAYVYSAHLPVHIEPEANKVVNAVKLATTVASSSSGSIGIQQHVAHNAYGSESIEEVSKKNGASSIAKPVAVVLNGENEPQFTDALGHKVPKPQPSLQVASPIDLLNPDRYEFYTFDEHGELVKRLMTMEEIQSIVANGDGEGPTIIHHGPSEQHDPEKNVQYIVDSVQNVLNKEVESNKNSSSDILPVFDTPDVSSSWSMILPAIFGNTGSVDLFSQQKPQQIVMTPDSELIETSTKISVSSTTKKPKPIKRKPGQKRKPSTTTSTTTEMIPQVIQEELDSHESVYTGMQQYQTLAASMQNYNGFSPLQMQPIYHKLPEQQEVEETTKRIIVNNQEIISRPSAILHDQTSSKEPAAVKQPNGEQITIKRPQENKQKTKKKPATVSTTEAPVTSLVNSTPAISTTLVNGAEEVAAPSTTASTVNTTVSKKKKKKKPTRQPIHTSAQSTSDGKHRPSQRPQRPRPSQQHKYSTIQPATTTDLTAAGSAHQEVLHNSYQQVTHQKPRPKPHKTTTTKITTPSTTSSTTPLTTPSTTTSSTTPVTTFSSYLPTTTTELPTTVLFAPKPTSSVIQSQEASLISHQPTSMTTKETVMSSIDVTTAIPKITTNSDLASVQIVTSGYPVPAFSATKEDSELNQYKKEPIPSLTMLQDKADQKYIETLQSFDQIMETLKEQDVTVGTVGEHNMAPQQTTMPSQYDSTKLQEIIADKRKKPIHISTTSTTTTTSSTTTTIPTPTSSPLFANYGGSTLATMMLDSDDTTNQPTSFEELTTVSAEGEEAKTPVVVITARPQYLASTKKPEDYTTIIPDVDQKISDEVETTELPGYTSFGTESTLSTDVNDTTIISHAQESADTFLTNQNAEQNQGSITKIDEVLSEIPPKLPATSYGEDSIQSEEETYSDNLATRLPVAVPLKVESMISNDEDENRETILVADLQPQLNMDVVKPSEQITMSDFQTQAATVASTLVDGTNTIAISDYNMMSSNETKDEIAFLMSDVIKQISNAENAYITKPQQSINYNDNRYSNVGQLNTSFLLPYKDTLNHSLEVKIPDAPKPIYERLDDTHTEDNHELDVQQNFYIQHNATQSYATPPKPITQVDESTTEDLTNQDDTLFSTYNPIGETQTSTENPVALITSEYTEQYETSNSSEKGITTAIPSDNSDENMERTTFKSNMVEINNSREELFESYDSTTKTSLVSQEYEKSDEKDSTQMSKSETTKDSSSTDIDFTTTNILLANEEIDNNESNSSAVKETSEEDKSDSSEMESATVYISSNESGDSSTKTLMTNDNESSTVSELNMQDSTEIDERTESYLPSTDINFLNQYISQDKSQSLEDNESNTTDLEPQYVTETIFHSTTSTDSEQNNSSQEETESQTAKSQELTEESNTTMDSESNMEGEYNKDSPSEGTTELPSYNGVSHTSTENETPEVTEINQIEEEISEDLNAMISEEDETSEEGDEDPYVKLGETTTPSTSTIRTDLKDQDAYDHVLAPPKPLNTIVENDVPTGTQSIMLMGNYGQPIDDSDEEDDEDQVGYQASNLSLPSTSTTTKKPTVSTTRRLNTLKPVSYFNKQPSYTMYKESEEPLYNQLPPATPYNKVHTTLSHNKNEETGQNKVTTYTMPAPQQRPMHRPPQLSNLMASSNLATRSPVKLDPSPASSIGLEASLANLDKDILSFAKLCNELAFSYWKSITSEKISSARSLVISPFALTSMLSMVFLGARGSTSGEMNDVLKLDDMVTFNPHLVFKNITDSVEKSLDSGIATTAFVREIFSDRANGRILQFFKEKTQQLYAGHVEEVNFHVVNDIIRRRTNLLVKRHTMGKVLEYLRTNSVWVNGPLATISANLFQTDCSRGSTQDRDGEMFFQVHPTVRQRRLVPVPAVLFKSGFTAGYEPKLDATVVAFGRIQDTVSMIYVMPGHQSSISPADNLDRLEKELIEKAIVGNAWSDILTALMDRPGMEIQIPRFSHRSFVNATLGLQKMGLKGLFKSDFADLGGLTGSSNSDIFLSDMIQINTFSTCGEEKIADHHHVEMYPAPPLRKRNKDVDAREDDEYDSSESIIDFGSLVQDSALGRGFYDDLLDPKYLELPLPLRPRQARVPDAPRLKFDKPFLYFVRHNPTGMLLFMGRFNPRLLP